MKTICVTIAALFFAIGGVSSIAWAQSVAEPVLPAREALPFRPVSGRAYVVGEVRTPGSYVLLAGSRLEDAVQQAGGISPRGSWRRIEVRTNGRKRFADLLRFRRFGEERHNPVVNAGDVVFVPLRKKTVSVLGAVRKPGLYEIVREKNIRAVLELAGGTSAILAVDKPLIIVRVDGEERKTISVESAEQTLQRTAIHDGDVLYAQEKGRRGLPKDLADLPLPAMEGATPFQENVVYVMGGVANPGPMPYQPYAQISHYVAEAGGFSSKAKTRRIKLIRHSGGKKRVRLDDPIRPRAGDTLHIPEKGMTGGDWAKVILGVVGVGLSTTATILSLTN
jgi:protein involved in polysaccharide export with SLBB domain